MQTPPTAIRLGISIPTINRKDLLVEAVAALVPQAAHFSKLLIIDNGHQQLAFDAPCICWVESPENLGVAASWNLGLRTLLADPSVTHVMVLNDDVTLGSDQLSTISSILEAHPDKLMFVGNYFWSVWVLSRLGAESMEYEPGKYFDERFFPAYFEDNDFYYRFVSKHKERYLGDLEELAPFVKRNSMTIQKDPSLNHGFSVNREYYIEKWGGMPGQEMRHPERGFETEFLYKRALTLADDIKEHLPVIRAYAEKCRHVTEFGAFAGATTWALMMAKPHSLHCYDLLEAGKHVTMEAARQADCELTLKKLNVLECLIDETDLLMIDTVGTYNQLWTELDRHAFRVQKYIIIHGTKIHGYEDEFPETELMLCRRGLCNAIMDFLEWHPEGKSWTVKETLPINKGLTVLIRVKKSE